MDKHDINQYGQNVDQDEKEISLQDIIYILRKRVWWILSTFVLVVAAVLGYLYFATPIYSATVTMRVEPSQAATSLDRMFTMPGTATFRLIGTEVELIKSRSNIEEVVNRLGLYDEYLASLEPGEEPSPKSRIVASVSGRISVSTVRDTNIVRISVEHADRNQAVAIANTLAEVYNDMLKQLAQNEFQVRRSFIEQQIPQLEADLMVAETNLRTYKEREGLFLLDEEARLLLQFVSTYDRQITPYRIQQDNAMQSIPVIQNLISQQGGTYPTLQEVRNREDIQDQLKQLIDARLELSSASASGAAAAADLRIAVTSRENRLTNSVSAHLSRSANTNDQVPLGLYSDLADAYAKVMLAETHINYLTDLRNTYQSQIRALPQIEQRMLELTREVKSKESLYILLLEKLEETKITEAGITGTAVIIDYAIPPTSPVSPNRRLILAVGALLGMFLGVLIAFLVETLDTSLRDEDAIRRAIGGDPIILGRVPRMNFTGKGMNELIVYNSPTSPGSEAYKLIATNVAYSRVKVPQIIAISSSEMSEGKTTVSTNISVAMAQNGLKTIIVDCDMRRPRLEQIFGLDKFEGGIVNYLLQKREISALIKKPLRDLPNLHVLPVGPLPPNPTAVLTSQRFEHMLNGLRKHYDRIILDLPPVLVASDATICSRISDGMLLVVRSGVSSRKGVALGADTLRGSQISLLGLVINDVTIDNRYGYYHYYYYYSGDDAGSGNSRKLKGKRKAAMRAAKRAMRQEKQGIRIPAPIGPTADPQAQIISYDELKTGEGQAGSSRRIPDSST